MKKYLLSILILISLQSNFAFGPMMHWLEGSWTGNGGDVNTNFNWTITLSYHPDDKVIILTYPSHSCGGNLLINNISTGKADCTEDLSYGLGGCNTGLKVTINQESDGSIVLEYYNIGTTSVKARAKLVRK